MMFRNNEVISIEEDLLNCRSMIRQFTFNNRHNHLKVCVLTLGASLASCKLDQHEIIVNTGLNASQSWDSNALQSTSRANWVSHVRGVDTLSLTIGSGSNQSQSMVYQLNADNELLLIGKFKSQQQLFHCHYFNLNSVTEKASVDGHLLHVRSSDASALIQQSASEVDGIFTNYAGDSPCAIRYVNGPDTDIVYSTDGNPETAIIATLQYERRMVQVTLHSMHHLQQQQTQNTFPCRLRVRITNSGVCIMPTMMSEFKCIYKFIWS